MLNVDVSGVFVWLKNEEGGCQRRRAGNARHHDDIILVGLLLGETARRDGTARRQVMIVMVIGLTLVSPHSSLGSLLSLLVVVAPFLPSSRPRVIGGTIRSFGGN